VDFKEWALEVNNLFNNLVESKNVTEFITSLKQTNVFWIDRVVKSGYKEASGVNEQVASATIYASDFINSYADGFGEKLRKEIGNDISNLRWRALIYPSEGPRLAKVVGQQLAMKERGAKSWIRVLHPELSKTGPCQLCIEDSQKVHSIDEWFTLLHPGDVCSMQEIYYYVEPPEMVTPESKPEVKVQVPGLPTFSEILDMLKDAVKKIGEGAKHIVRRIRGV
jgi:hypothetical protein